MFIRSKNKNILKPKKKGNRRSRPRPLLCSEMLPSLRIIFYRLCNLFSPGYIWKHKLRKPSNKVFFQTFHNRFGKFGLVDWPIELCGVLISFSLDILSLFCTNQPFYIQINQEKHMVPIFQKCKRPPDNFQMFST